MRRRLGLLALAGSLLVGAAPFERTEEREACREHDPLRRPFFGDLHVHTRHSLDASTQGTRTTPRQAYRFARGERIGLQPFDADGVPGRSARLSRPLDFAAVTDHSELFGETAICNTPELLGHDSVMCRVYRGWPRFAFFTMNSRLLPRFGFCGPEGAGCLEAARGPWQEMQEAADAEYDRAPECRFTTFVGYEWTQAEERVNNLHRNVIFRNAQVPERAISAFDAPAPHDLWDALDRECRRERPGCDAVVIPHNSNLSGGYMFQTELLDGTPFTAEYAARRSQAEPLVEIMQHKGDSECGRGAGTQDELCAFEKLPYQNFMGRYLAYMREPSLPINYVRTALGQGLVLGEKLGANPFRLGVVASTDTHLGTPGLVAEDADYPGHGGAGIAVGEVLPEGLLDPIEFNPGGLAVLWAEENSRDALFAAMQRREAYGTSGPRIALRVFAGWDYPADLCGRSDLVAQGYAGGVPMGGELRAAAASGAAPVLVVRAERDPDAQGVPLERLQVIKLWAEAGEARERVVDVAGAPGSASVDPRTCAPAGEGADVLCAVWRDPEFDPARPALYYARAVENPTCRWSAHVCNAHGVDCANPDSVGEGFELCCDPAFPSTLQERAWSSPIWYTP